MLQTPYHKEWYVQTSIAKCMIGMEQASRIPTITEYAQWFECSRGLVQNALNFLEEHKAVVLDKQGKRGTFLAEKQDESLFRYSGLSHLTASMPPPVNRHFAGLATGICNGMSKCSVPFTFAFVQGSENRVQALLSRAYDFVVISQCAANTCVAENPELEIAFPFVGCEYSRPYKLYINQPGKQGVEDGMVIAMDPTSSDHVAITQKICAGKNVEIREMPFLSALYAFYTGQIDCIAFRDGLENGNDTLFNLAMKNEISIAPNRISRIPIEGAEDMQLPVALVHKENYGMAGILQRYLAQESVGVIQQQVVNGECMPQFY